MRLLVRSSVALAAAVALCATLAAQAKPNFSGEWTLVLSKSDFGPLPPPASMTRTITHQDPSLKIVTVQSGGPMGDTKIEATFTTDGKPQKNTVNGGPMTTVGKWDGATIVLNSVMSQPTGDIPVEDRYSLSDAGKTLTVTRKFSPESGPFTVRIVLAKK